MNVRNTLLFLAVMGLVLGLAGGIGTARAAPHGGGGHSGGGTGFGGHNMGGHDGGQRQTNSVVNNNSAVSDGSGGSTSVVPLTIAPAQQGTPYPCPAGYFPVGAEGLPFGYHVCRLSPQTINKAESEGTPVSSWDVDYKAEAAKTRAQIEYLKAQRELLNELGED
jgi:hypothetical protein